MLYLLAICLTSLVDLSIYYTNSSKPIYPVTQIVLTLLYSRDPTLEEV